MRRDVADDEPCRRLASAAQLQLPRGVRSKGGNEDYSQLKGERKLLPPKDKLPSEAAAREPFYFGPCSFRGVRD